MFCVEKGKAVARQVTTGIQSEERIEILSGLKEGDEVVTGQLPRDLEGSRERRRRSAINNERPPDKPDATASRE